MKKQLILAGLILAGAALTFSGCGNSKNNQSTAPAEKTSIIVGATAVSYTHLTLPTICSV